MHFLWYLKMVLWKIWDGVFGENIYRLKDLEHTDEQFDVDFTDQWKSRYFPDSDICWESPITLI